jgi:hypothetical protein
MTTSRWLPVASPSSGVCCYHRGVAPRCGSQDQLCHLRLIRHQRAATGAAAAEGALPALELFQGRPASRIDLGLAVLQSKLASLHESSQRVIHCDLADSQHQHTVTPPSELSSSLIWQGGQLQQGAGRRCTTLHLHTAPFHQQVLSILATDSVCRIHGALSSPAEQGHSC